MPDRPGSPAENGGARAGRGAADRGRYAKVTEDPLDHGGLLDERDQTQPAATPRTR